MYRVSNTSVPLTHEEKQLFKPHLEMLGLDHNIWDVYEQFLNTPSEYSTPGILRMYDHNLLLAVVFIMKCRNYGPTLTSSTGMHRIIRNSGVPVYIWMKSGVAAETFTNPGFLNVAVEGFDQIKLLQLIKKQFFLLFIHDLAANTKLHPDSVKLQYPDNGIIETRGFKSIQDYLSLHKNLKKKLRHYSKNGGRVDVVPGKLNKQLQLKIKQSVLSTSQLSLFKLPFQENYANMCMSSADIDNQRIIHFICRSDEVFYGYHTFIRFENQMYCMNGAFNRNLPTTHHAYENMIYSTVEYGIEQGISSIHYGPVLNETKKRMMEQFIPTQLYVYSYIPGAVKIVSPFLKKSGLQNTKLLEYSGIQ